jgi:hypothetical protein
MQLAIPQKRYWQAKVLASRRQVRLTLSLLRLMLP